MPVFGSNFIKDTKKFADTANDVSSALNLLQGIIPKDVYQKTLGAALKYGFDCWGASWNPGRAEREFNVSGPKMHSDAESIMSNIGADYADKVNQWIFDFYGYHSTQRNWLNTSARKCTREGLEVLIDSEDALYSKIIPLFIQRAREGGHQLKKIDSLNHTYPPESHTARHSFTIDLPQYELVENVYQVKSNGVLTSGTSVLGILGVLGVLAALFGKKILKLN